MSLKAFTTGGEYIYVANLVNSAQLILRVLRRVGITKLQGTCCKTETRSAESSQCRCRWRVRGAEEDKIKLNSARPHSRWRTGAPCWHFAVVASGGPRRSSPSAASRCGRRAPLPAEPPDTARPWWAPRGWPAPAGPPGSSGSSGREGAEPARPRPPTLPPWLPVWQEVGRKGGAARSAACQRRRGGNSANASEVSAGEVKVPGWGPVLVGGR